MAENDDVEKDLKAVTASGKRLKLEGKELAEYVHKHMIGYGHKSVRTYTAGDDSGKKRGGGFFGRSSDDDDDDDM